jgi:UDP-glucose 4-epimerase
MIMLTGGLGYIGSNTALMLLRANYEILIYDNLSNSSLATLKTLQDLSNHKINFINGDIADTDLLINSLKDFQIDTVIHFAGLKAVSESVLLPLNYYKNNLLGTINLIDVMETLSIHRLIFSSSATVYGTQATLPINESQPKQCINPYGRTKSFIEDMLIDISAANSNWKISCLRYFNPVGADISGYLGDNYSAIPNNLLPRIVRVAAGELEALEIFGSNYQTHDGTCERDYIHVSDLADGHLAALEYLSKQSNEIEFFNLGTGSGCSVLELISIFEEVTGMSVPCINAVKREGDSESSYACADKANKLLGWNAKRSLKDMCATAWNSYKLKESSHHDS